MKKTTNKLLAIFFFIGITTSCGGDEKDNGGDVIQKHYTKEHVGIPTALNFGEIKYLNKLTVADSMNIIASKILPVIQKLRLEIKQTTQLIIFSKRY